MTPDPRIQQAIHKITKAAGFLHAACDILIDIDRWPDPKDQPIQPDSGRPEPLPIRPDTDPGAHR